MTEPEKEWWHPYTDEDNESLDWLCDHLGDAMDVMVEMWSELCKLKSDLPKDGWPMEEDE